MVRGDGSEAAAGEEGELVQSGPLVAQGYWRDPVRTAERFRGGELWSGDTLVKGADGLLRFRGRDDAMIKVSGNRVSPTEIEEGALASGAVSDAAAFGRGRRAIGAGGGVGGGGQGRGCRGAVAGLFSARDAAVHGAGAGRLARALPVGPNGKLDRAALKGEIG